MFKSTRRTFTIPEEVHNYIVMDFWQYTAKFFVSRPFVLLTSVGYTVFYILLYNPTPLSMNFYFGPCPFDNPFHGWRHNCASRDWNADKPSPEHMQHPPPCSSVLTKMNVGSGEGFDNTTDNTCMLISCINVLLSRFQFVEKLMVFRLVLIIVSLQPKPFLRSLFEF